MGEQVHMKTIAVAINKGGAGKTTVARSLGAAATAAGLNVLVLDMDSQQTATQWGRRRKDSLPMVRFTTENDLPAELERAAAARCDLVVIDTPPARSSEAPAAVEAADLVLIPFTADIEAFEQFHEPLASRVQAAGPRLRSSTPPRQTAAARKTPRAAFWTLWACAWSRRCCIASRSTAMLVALA